jgi:hypothetical protein
VAIVSLFYAVKDNLPPNLGRFLSEYFGLEQDSVRPLPPFELRYLKVLYLSGPTPVCLDTIYHGIESHAVEAADRAGISGAQQTRIFFQLFRKMIVEHWLLWIYGNS